MTGDSCPGCGGPLAADQRYCLNCGLRRADSKPPFADAAERREPVAAARPAPVSPHRNTIAAGLGAAMAAVLIGMGVLIGAISADKELRTIQPAAAPVQKPPVINVNAGGGGAATEAGGEFASDWPEGKKGYTVQLRTLANDSPTSEVEAAKSEAQEKGAKDVGALNSDDYASLPAGNFVIYSGVFTGKSAKKDAQAALNKLKTKFKKAKVVRVDPDASAEATGAKTSKTLDDRALEDLQNATGAEQQKKSARLPEELKLEGKPPPKDNKKPGGGSDSVEIR